MQWQLHTLDLILHFSAHPVPRSPHNCASYIADLDSRRSIKNDCLGIEFESLIRMQSWSNPCAFLSFHIQLIIFQIYLKFVCKLNIIDT